LTWVEVDFEAAEVKLESPAAAKPDPAPSKYSIIFRALLPAPDANIAIWMGAADETDEVAGAADAVEGAVTEPPIPNTFAPTRAKYPLKKRNCPVKKLTKMTEKGHKMVKNRG
jgi:hypothetical protein